jgi:ribose transport system substrate-binding protein
VLIGASSLLAVACSGKDPEPIDTGTGPLTCENDPYRPTAIFDAVKALKAKADGVKDNSTINVTVIPNHWSPFWMTPSIGLAVAKREIGCQADLTAAALKGDPNAVQLQVDKMNALVAAKSSGFGVSCKSATAALPAITAARAAGIPVITFDSDVAKGVEGMDVPFGGRSMYFGSLNYPAAAAGAKPMVDALAGSGKVLIVSSTPTELNAQQRVEGFRDAVAAQGAQMQTTEYMLGDEYNAFVKAEPDPTKPSKDINAFFSSYLKDLLATDPPGGIFVTQGTYGPVAADAVLAANLQGQVHIIAFDLATDTQRHLRNKVIDAAIVQKSYFFGYLGTYILWAMAVNGPDAVMETLQPYVDANQLMDTGVDIVTPTTLDGYTKYQIDCLGLPNL